jgi:hypothetical protein
MKSTTSHVLRQSVGGFLVVACGLSIGSIAEKTGFQYRRLESYQSLQRELVHPPLVDIRADELLDPALYRVIEQSPGRTIEKRNVLLVTDGSRSSHCRLGARTWLELAAKLYRRGDLEVWVLRSFTDLGDSPLRTLLARQGLPWRIVVPSGPPAFGVRTGIRAMPIGVVVTETGMVACVLNGVPSSLSVDQCDATLSTSKRRTLIATTTLLEPWLFPDLSHPGEVQ